MGKYGGPYLHELAMGDAYKRLYMLGNRPYHSKSKELGEEIGEGALGMVDKVRKDKSDRDARNLSSRELAAIEKLNGGKLNTAGKMYGASDYAALANDGMEGYEQAQERRAVSNGQALPEMEPGHNPYENALAAADMHEMAQHARIGGHYTNPGLQKTMKDADDLGHDKAYGNMLFGLGGTLPPQPTAHIPEPTLPPPNYMQNYRIPQ